jgi:hypothetical protein
MLVERWAEGEPLHEQVTERVTVTTSCDVHPVADLTPAQLRALEQAGIEAFLLGPDPDEERDFPG